MSESVTVNDDGTATVIVTDETVTVVTDLTTGAAAVAAHELEGDPHPGYVLESAIGVSVQAYDADLTAIAALLPGLGNAIIGNGSAWVAQSGASLRTSLGLGAGDAVTHASLILSAGTIASGGTQIAATQTRDSGATTFDPVLDITVTDTASAAGSLVARIRGGAGTTTILSVGKTCGIFMTADGNGAMVRQVSNQYITFANNTGVTYGGFLPGGVFLGSPTDSYIVRGGQQRSWVFGINADGAGGSNTKAEFHKPVTAFSNGVPKSVLTFTIPNAPHSASFQIRVVGSLGTGGSVGANEATQTATYQVDIARTAGKNAVATISAVYPQAASATVSGGQNIATTAALGAVSGAVGATNTVTVDATLTRAGSGADNHTALVHCSLLNANGTGVTVA